MKKVFYFLLITSVVQSQEPPEESEELQYNIELPTGEEQSQPVYYTKDLLFKVGTTKVGFYGFFLADLTSETRIAGSSADVKPTFIPLSTDSASQKTQTVLDARNSRLGFKIEDDLSGVLMKGAIETDFFTFDGDAIAKNARHMRLRLAYATAELPSHFFFLTGQYYTLPMHYPEIDMPTRVNILFYPAGVVNSRQPQFRIGYKQYFSDATLLQYEMNAESQGYNTTGVVTEKGGDTAQASFQKWPLFTTKVTWISDHFKANIALSSTKAYVVANESGTRLDTWVWGGTSTAALYWGNLTLWGTAHHYVGLTGLGDDFLKQITLVNADTELKALTSNGWTVALRFDFLKGSLWTDLMYGIEKGDPIAGSSLFSGNTLKKVEDFRVNLIGAFWKNWQIGLEYERTYIRAFNNTAGCNNQVHLGVWYIFGQP